MGSFINKIGKTFFAGCIIHIIIIFSSVVLEGSDNVFDLFIIVFNKIFIVTIYVPLYLICLRKYVETKFKMEVIVRYTSISEILSSLNRKHVLASLLYSLYQILIFVILMVINSVGQNHNLFELLKFLVVLFIGNVVLWYFFSWLFTAFYIIYGSSTIAFLHVVILQCLFVSFYDFVFRYFPIGKYLNIFIIISDIDVLMNMFDSIFFDIYYLLLTLALYGISSLLLKKLDIDKGAFSERNKNI